MNVTGQRPRRGRSVMLVVTAVVALASCKKEGGEQAGGPPEVTVAKPAIEKAIDWDEYTGHFEAVDTVDIRARVSGYLNSVHFNDGQYVEKGALLYEIDPRPYQAALDRAHADMLAATARLKLADRDVTRGQELVKNKTISQENFDQRIQARDEANASLAAAQAAERAAALNVEFAQIKAPISGRISDNRVSVGNLVSGGDTGGTLLTTIVTVDPIDFVFDASESAYLKYSRQSKSGERVSSRDTPNPVRVRLLDETDFTHEGHMDFVDNALNAQTGTLRGRALIPNPDRFLSPGQFGRLQLLGSGEYDAILIPDSAILSDQAKKFVWVIGDDGKVQQRYVTLGHEIKGLRAIREGLNAQDRVVIDGVQRIRPGVDVTAKDGTIQVASDAK